MALGEYKKLPPEVLDIIWGAEIADRNQEIFDRLSFNRKQIRFILDLEGDIFYKKLIFLIYLKS